LLSQTVGLATIGLLTFDGRLMVKVGEDARVLTHSMPQDEDS
jgi:hypothetical protein